MFDRDLVCFTRPQLRPPELSDLSKGAIVTPKADIWQLGALLNSLITVSGNASEPKYSAQLMSLKTLMLRSNPRERPSAADVIHYITSKESLARPGMLPSDEPDSAPAVHPMSGGKEQTRGFFSGVREKLVKYMNKTGTRGWVTSATESIDTEPKHKYVRKLITKAWEKPQKVIKFYEELKSRDIMKNTVIALKACITIQHYIYNGSKACIRPQQNPELPLTLLCSLRSSWENICMSHESNPYVLPYGNNSTVGLLQVGDPVDADNEVRRVPHREGEVLVHLPGRRGRVVCAHDPAPPRPSARPEVASPV